MPYLHQRRTLTFALTHGPSLLHSHLTAVSCMDFVQTSLLVHASALHFSCSGRCWNHSTISSLSSIITVAYINTNPPGRYSPYPSVQLVSTGEGGEGTLLLALLPLTVLTPVTVTVSRHLMWTIDHLHCLTVGATEAHLLRPWCWTA